jgi:transposase-like protein
MKEVVRYSETFKLRLVEDVASGKYKSSRVCLPPFLR